MRHVKFDSTVSSMVVASQGMNAYNRYKQGDDLCQTNGHFSLNLRKKHVDDIDRLLALSPGNTVGWIGCGDGRELFSMAMRYPCVRFQAYDINELALQVARRVLRELALQNVVLIFGDFLTSQPTPKFTHVYSTAISGPELYRSLEVSCTKRLCMLETMWMDGRELADDIACVKLSGSGEQRLLRCRAYGKVCEDET